MAAKSGKVSVALIGGMCATAPEFAGGIRDGVEILLPCLNLLAFPQPVSPEKFPDLPGTVSRDC